MGIIAAIGGLASAYFGNKSAEKAASEQRKASDAAVAASLTGFNYLKGNDAATAAQSQGLTAGRALNAELGLDPQAGPGKFQEFLGLQQGLLGMGDSEQSEAAFARFRDSTGYQFRLGEGMGAVTGSAAAKGLLNSGATLRALSSLGQNMASSELGNYFGQLQGAMGDYQNYLGQLGAVQATGLNSAFNTASGGTSGGASAANAILGGASNIAAARRQGSEDVASGLGVAVGGLTDWWQNRQKPAA